MLKKLIRVLKDPFVKDNFVSMGIFGTVLLVISAFVFGVARFLGIQEPVLDFALGFVSFVSLIPIGIGGLGILSSLFDCKE
jgi:hypothetical protein